MSGQINSGDFFGDQIFNLSSVKEFENFVEVGTWNGQGSTKCFMDAILYRNDPSKLYTVEANIEFFEQASKYWQPLVSLNRIPYEKLEMLYGRVIEAEELIPIDEIKNHKIYNKHPWLEWRERNVSEYQMCENITEKLPESIDVLLLDGGQFSTLAEWERLKSRTKVILLDDTTTFKTEKIRNELIESDEWVVVFDKLNYRNGIFAACRTEHQHLISLNSGLTI